MDKEEKKQQQPAKPTILTPTQVKKKVKEYDQVYGPSTKQLNRGLWWINNRLLIQRIGYGILIVFSVVVWGYGIYGFGYYLSRGMQEDEQILNSLSYITVNPFVTPSKQAQELKIGKVNVFKGVDNSYDLVSEIQNNNEEWYTTFDYSFVIGSNQTEIQHEFINPKETKYLTQFLYKKSRPSTAGVKIENIEWHRVDKHQISDINKYITESTNIEISEVDVKVEGSGTKTLSRISFNAVNNTSYNYWDIDFYLLLKSGNRLTGINKYKASHVRSGESRDFSILWSGRVSSNIDIIPSVDIFSENNKFEFDFGAGQLK